jgi:tRNA nucleotidyltransferase (CCA-adding enzyme)
MQTYLVGGAVRDKLLGIPTNDRDFVVVGSNKKEMLALGFKQVGKDFPVFLHPETHEEYALARIEKKIGLGYTGFEFETKNVSLKEDLSRRDLTINSMAIDENGKLIDYFGGENDLQQGLLRHTSGSFIEDPVRVLRTARFVAKFKNFGFKLSHPTFKLIKQMVKNGEIDNLVPERVFSELDKVLTYQTPSAFFKTLLATGAYNKIFQTNIKTTNHHNSFTFLDNLDCKNHIKFALWLNNHSEDNAKNINKILKTPKKYAQLSLLSIKFKELGQNFAKIDNENKLNLFLLTDGFRRQDRFYDLLKVWNLLGVEIKTITDIFNKLQKLNFDVNAQDGVAKLKSDRLKLIANYVG